MIQDREIETDVKRLSLSLKYTFKDFYRNTVQLSFEHEPFSNAPKHVWVICRYQHQWLLTQH